nr:hypothetical protein [Tanacetum cinerariifolium]
MFNNKCRTSFAKPEFLKKAQRANPRLYDIGCYNDNLALMLAPDTDEVIRLEKEIRSKLSDLIRPFNYDKLNNLISVGLNQFHKCLNEEMVADLRYFNPLESEVVSLRSQLETQKKQFLNEIDRLSREYYSADHMNAILGVYTELDEVTNLQWYSTQSRAYRVFNKRTRVIIESIHVNFNELPQMASDQISSDPTPECQTMVLEHGSLSPGTICQVNVTQGDRTVSTSNELDLLFSPMFDELLNGSSKGNDILTGSRGTDLYSITLQDTNSLNPICLMAKATSSQAWLWHHRLSHSNFATINLLSKNDIVVGLPKVKFVKDHLCSSCELGKAKRKSFHSKLTPSSKRQLKLLHMDLCGPMRVASINGKRYVLMIVDDYSRYTWTHFLRSKDKTPKVFIDFLRLVQRGLQAQVRVVRTNKGTEFLNQTLHAYFAAEGILHQTSVARTPEQNGVVERQNRTLVEAARTMLSAAKVPLFFWAEAIATLCFTQNRSLVIPRHEKTPYHIINDRKPSVKFIYIFGSTCYIVKDGENLDKMKEKERSRLSHINVNNGKSKASFNKQTTLLEKRMDESIPLDKQCQSSLEIFKVKTRISAGLNQFHMCLNEEMVADLRYFNSLESEVDSLRSQLETQKTQFLNEIDWFSREYYYADHMNAILGVYTELDEVTNLQCIVISELKKLIEKLKRKSVGTKFEKSSVIRQPNAFKSQRPSVLGKPTTFLNSFVRKDFSKSTSVTQTHVSNDFSKPVTVQTLPTNKKSILKNTNVLAPRMYKLHTKSSQTRTSQVPQYSRKTNKRVSFSTGVILTTSVSRPQLKSNPQGDRVMHNNSQGKKQEVEDPHRSVKLSKNKMSVPACNDSLNAKTLNVKYVSTMCDKCMLIDKHDLYVFKSVAKPIKETVTSESNKKPINFTRKLYECVSKTCSWWYPKFTPSGYKWKPKSGKENVNPNLVEIVLFIVDSGCSKHMMGNLKLLINFVEKFLETVKFKNDQIAPILGYGDMVQGAVMIKRVYYVEGLNYNLFSVGQFCDADLEIAFRKSTCFIHDLKGNDLPTCSRGTDLYSITLQDTNCPNPICLMAKASSSQAWLWHRRLSHLNFDTINLLSKNDIVVGLPKLKFVKDHLCSSCELGKAKQKSFHTKVTPSSKRRLQLLHIDLCGPMRVASINRKRYVLVIVDDYSRYTWTHFLRSKDETPKVLIDFLRLVQRGLQAQVRVVRTDKGTEFLNQTLHAYFAAEGILHQMSVARTPEQNGDEEPFAGPDQGSKRRTERKEPKSASAPMKTATRSAGRDVNINQGRGIQTTQEVEDLHVTLTPVNLDGQQPSLSVSSQFVTSMLNPTLDAGMESIFETTSQMDVQTPTSMNEAVQVAVQLQSDRLREEAQKENDEFLKTIDENMQKNIKDQVKEQVKVQVSKILPRIEQSVNEQLEAEVLTRSSNSSKTSYVVADDLSEMELKKILIEKMEGNKSIHRSNEQRNLYKALVEAYESDKIILDTYEDTVTLKTRHDDDADKDEEPSVGPDRGSKRRGEGKEPESASAPTETTTRSAGRSTEESQSRQMSASESVVVEEPMQTTFEMEEPSHPEFKTGADDQPIVESSQHPEWFSQQQKPPTPNRDWNKTLPATHRSIQPWISELANIVIQRRVEDLQLGVESYQKKLNLTKPDTYHSDLKRNEAYIAYTNPRGFIYQNKDKKNRYQKLMKLYMKEVVTQDSVPVSIISNRDGRFTSLF